jgi:hypothetical protein
MLATGSDDVEGGAIGFNDDPALICRLIVEQNCARDERR